MEIPTVADFNTEIERAMIAFQIEITKMINELSSGGTMAFSSENLRLATDNYTQMVNLLEQAGFGDIKKNIIASESATITAFKAFNYPGSVPFKLLAVKDVPIIAALQDTELLQLLNLETSVSQAVYSRLVDGVLTGQSTDESIRLLGKTLDTQTRYIKTWYETSRQQFEQKVQDLSAANYKEEFGGGLYWEYIGAPKDDKTRYECDLALSKLVFTDAEKQSFETGGMFDAQVPRYNCRHIFWQITERRYKEMTN